MRCLLGMQLRSLTTVAKASINTNRNGASEEQPETSNYRTKTSESKPDTTVTENGAKESKV